MVGLATRDFRHERGLSLFAVLSVTAVVAPLLVLFGLKYGVISSMTARLDRDPGTRMLQPIGQGMHDARWFAALAARPETGFVVPSTRFLAATASLSNPAEENRPPATVELWPTASGDPLAP